MTKPDTEPPLEPTKPEFKWSWGRLATPMPILVGIAGLALTVGGLWFTHEREISQQRLLAAKEDAERAKAETDRIKAAQPPDKDQSDKNRNVKPPESIPVPPNDASAPKLFKVLIRKGETAQFDKYLSLMLTNVTRESNVYKVNATVFLEGHKAMRIVNALVNAVVEYPDDGHGYQIHIISANDDGAKFTITKLP